MLTNKNKQFASHLGDIIKAMPVAVFGNRVDTNKILG